MSGDVLFQKYKYGWMITHDKTNQTNIIDVNNKLLLEVARINDNNYDEPDELILSKSIFTEDIDGYAYITHETMGWLLSYWQEQCFHLNKMEIRQRLLEQILNHKSTTIAICMAWSGDWIASVVLEEKQASKSIDNPRPRGLYLNECCKSGTGAPAPYLLDIPFQKLLDFAKTLVHRYNEIFLFVKIDPIHGFGASLNKLYSDRYGFRMHTSRYTGVTTMKRDLKDGLYRPPPKTLGEHLIYRLAEYYRNHTRFIYGTEIPKGRDEVMEFLQEYYLITLQNNGWSKGSVAIRGSGRGIGYHRKKSKQKSKKKSKKKSKMLVLYKDV